MERIKASTIKELVMLNTISIPEENKIDNLVSISVAPLFSKAIKRIHEGTSVSELFD